MIRTRQVDQPALAATRPARLAAVVRSGLTESVHHGHLLVSDASGDVLALGEVDAPMWPRSAVKPLQAVAMLRAGLSIGQDGLALAASSHEGTPVHLDLVRSVLAGAGLTEAELQNTPDLPLGQAAALAWSAAGHGPSSLTQNCSGKHAAMLATCVRAGWDTRTYRDPEHPLQVTIRRTLEDLTGVPVNHVGVDGCGAPLFSTTLRGLARAFSRIATAGPGTHENAVARAVATHPHLVGGPHRDVSAILAAVPGLVAKDGAEGVFAAALPDGSALALKVADGSGRPVRAVVADALERLAPAELHEALREMGRTAVLGHGQPVGEVRSLLPARLAAAGARSERVAHAGVMRIVAERGDLTTTATDVVVNAANATLLGGGGVDGALHEAAGPRLLEACRRVRRTTWPDGLPVGEAVATEAFDLPAR